jgi:hypothetical protein
VSRDNAPLEPPLIPLIFIVKTNTCKHYTHIANTHTSAVPATLCLQCINTQQRSFETNSAVFLFLCFVLSPSAFCSSSSRACSCLPRS